MSPKEITGFIKSLGRLNGIAIVLSYTPCWGGVPLPSPPSSQLRRKVNNKERVGLFSVFIKSSYELLSYPVQAVVHKVSVTALLVKCDVLMTVILHLKSHLLVIEKFSKRVLPYVSWCLIERCVILPIFASGVFTCNSEDFTRICTFDPGWNHAIFIANQLFLWQKNDRYFCT